MGAFSPVTRLGALVTLCPVGTQEAYWSHATHHIQSYDKHRKAGLCQKSDENRGRQLVTENENRMGEALGQEDAGETLR